MTAPANASIEPADDLRAVMSENSLTQREVAGLACVSVKTVESWLADKASASFRLMHWRHIRTIRFALPQHMAAKRGRKA